MIGCHLIREDQDQSTLRIVEPVIRLRQTIIVTIDHPNCRGYGLQVALANFSLKSPLTHGSCYVHLVPCTFEMLGTAIFAAQLTL